MADWHWLQEVMSRKDRRCDECAGAILAGQTYAREKQVVDGEWYTAAVCLPCRALTEHMYRVHGDDIVDPPRYGQVRETLEAVCDCEGVSDGTTVQG